MTIASLGLVIELGEHAHRVASIFVEQSGTTQHFDADGPRAFALQQLAVVDRAQQISSTGFGRECHVAASGQAHSAKWAPAS